MKVSILPKKNLNVAESGFTLMEIVVSTTIFVILVSALFSLYNFTLQLNRRTEALRQASQGMRSFVEFLVKEVRNGKIDYGVSSGAVANPTWTFPSGALSNPCGKSPAVNNANVLAGGNSYLSTDNKLGILADDGTQECIFFADGTGAPIDNGRSSPNQCLAGDGNCGIGIIKTSVNGTNILNPKNFQVNYLAFYVRPLKDPYNANPSGNGLVKVQPAVTIVLQVTATLPTSEKQVIYYQTTASTNKYDVPSH